MCIKRPVLYEYDIGTKRGVDLISVGHTDNNGSDCIELRLVQNGEQVDVSDATVTACYVMRKTNCLVSDGVPCAVNEVGNILVPFDHAAIQSLAGDMNIEISVTNHKRTLTLPYPLWVRVHRSILDNAGVTPDTQGTVAELLERAKEALGRVEGYVDEKTVCKIVEEKIEATIGGVENGAY